MHAIFLNNTLHVVCLFSFQDMSGKTFEDIFKGKEDRLKKKLDTGDEFLAKLVKYKVINEGHKKIEVNSITLFQVCFNGIFAV